MPTRLYTKRQESRQDSERNTAHPSWPERPGTNRKRRRPIDGMTKPTGHASRQPSCLPIQ